MRIPKRFTTGDTVTWNDPPWMDSATRTLCTSSVWQLTYQLRGPAEATVAAEPNGGGWTSTMDMAQSAALLPGTYIWSAYLSQTGQRMCIAGGTLFVAQDLSQIDAVINAVSLAQQALNACEKALSTFTSSGGQIKRYSIANRETEFQSLADIMKLRDFWQSKVNYERTRDATRNRRANPRHLKVRF